MGVPTLLATLACAGLIGSAVGCAGSGGPSEQSTPVPSSLRPAAVPAVAQVPDRSGARARPADFSRPIAEYRRYVVRRLSRMSDVVARLRAHAALGDRAAARADWIAADALYESIGAAYGAFGDLDTAINGRRHRAGDPHVTGLHAVERLLWTRGADPRAAVTQTERLARDVARLRGAVPTAFVSPLDYGLRAHEILEDALHLQLTGIAAPWSGRGLDALDANLHGTRVVLRTLGPLMDHIQRGLRTRATVTLAALQASVDSARRPDGTLPPLGALSTRQRERIGGALGGALETLALVPQVLDPRVPRRLGSL